MQKKSPYIIETLNFGSFPGKIMFSVGYSFEDICKELKKQKLSDWLDAFKTVQYLFDSKNSGFASHRILTINGQEYHYNFLHLRDRFDFSDKAHATLSHEIIHTCTHNLSDLLDIVKENEAFAYTHTHILNQCYSILRKNKIHDRRKNV